MPYGPIFAGLVIQAGAFMIQAGMEKVVPELTKLLDSPELEKAFKDLRIQETLTKTFIDITHHPKLKK